MALGGFSGPCSCRVSFRAGAAPRAIWASYGLVPGQRRGRGEGDGRDPTSYLPPTQGLGHRRGALDGCWSEVRSLSLGVGFTVSLSRSAPAPQIVVGPGTWEKPRREGPEAAQGFRPTRAGGAAPAGSLRTRDSEMRPTESGAHSDPLSQTGPIFGLKPLVKGAADKAPLCSLSLRFRVNREIGLRLDSMCYEYSRTQKRQPKSIYIYCFEIPKLL